MKRTFACFNLQRNGNPAENGLPNIKDTFAENYQLQGSVLQQSRYIFKAGLSSLSNDWTRYKEKGNSLTDLNESK